MNFELTGNLLVKEDIIEVNQSFKKRDFVIEVPNERNNDWNDFIKFQAVQERCNLIDNFEIGDKIKVSFNIRGRKWEKDGKVNYFSNLEAWRIEKAEQTAPADVPAPDITDAGFPDDDPNNDLPF